MIKVNYILPVLTLVIIGSSCTDDGSSDIEAPATYAFERAGESTVNYEGQTTRILMATELADGLLNTDLTAEVLAEMYTNSTADGGDANPFANEDLNSSTKSVRSKVAASTDFFATNTVVTTNIKNQFSTWISKQVEEVYPNWGQAAALGVPGQLADGTSVRYVNAKGLEYDQLVGKSLIGALMVDQMLNNYLSPAVLDAGSNIADNDNGTTADGAAYTNMEHKWDEAYGYLFGLSADGANPLADLGNDDFLNKYIARVEGDEDFAGIASTIYDALKLGRAAIVAKDYDVRDKQADIIKEEVSKVIGIRAVYYLQQGKRALADGNFGTAFHDLSEGYGFIYSLQFTRKPGSDDPYMTTAEVTALLSSLEAGDGLWSVTAETLDEMSADIADRFDFTVEAAAE